MAPSRDQINVSGSMCQLTLNTQEEFQDAKFQNPAKNIRKYDQTAQLKQIHWANIY